MLLLFIFVSIDDRGVSVRGLTSQEFELPWKDIRHIGVYNLENSKKDIFISVDDIKNIDSKKLVLQKDKSIIIGYEKKKLTKIKGYWDKPIYNDINVY